MNPLLLIAIATITVTPTPSVVSTPTLTNSDEIQKIREVVQQKVKEKLKQIVAPEESSQKGLVGKIIQIDKASLSLEYQNSLRTIKIDSAATFIDQNRNKTKLENLKIGQDILALGINDSGNFTAKRIIVIDLKTLINSKVVAIGKIVDISKTTNIFTLIPSKNKNNLYQIKTDQKTEIFDKAQQKLTISTLKSGHKVIVVLSPDPKISKTYSALKIYDLDYTPSPTPTKKP